MNTAQDVINYALEMNRRGINHGTSGNVSIRHENGFLVTPSGLDYDVLTPEKIVFVDLEGNFQGPLKPSSEWLFHRDIYLNRPEINAVIHTHSKYATALACLRQDLPSFHYMVAIAGGKNVRCAPYAPFGTQELSEVALIALKDRNACLLANHGMIVCSTNLSKTLKIAEEIEVLCEQYLATLQNGGPVLLTDEEMDLVLEKFKTYGKQPRT